MLHKYIQNITFNVINTQIHTKKKNLWRNKQHLSANFALMVFWPPSHFSTRVNILSDRYTNYWQTRFSVIEQPMLYVKVVM